MMVCSLDIATGNFYDCQQFGIWLINSYIEKLNFYVDNVLYRLVLGESEDDPPHAYTKHPLSILMNFQ